jgi:hypothetical protein
MKANLELEMGPKTCASEPGKLCKMYRTSRFGTKESCGLFNVDLYEGENGWIQRCDQCLAMFPEPAKT